MTLLTEIKSSEWQLSLSEQGKVVEGIDDVNQCIYIILQTRKGEDSFRPEFGCGIFDHIDRPVTESLPVMMKAITDSINLWEPRVRITKITPKVTLEGVQFNITWKLTDAVDTGQIDITYGIR